MMKLLTLLVKRAFDFFLFLGREDNFCLFLKSVAMKGDIQALPQKEKTLCGKSILI
jgi:hypothetical protein